MKSQDALKRQIRKLLMLAADDRGDKATAKAAAALAKRLLRANGWSEDDLRGEGEAMPGDAHIRLVCKDDNNFERHLAVSNITVSQNPSVIIDARLSPASGIAMINFRGKMQDLGSAQKLWLELNRLLTQEWFAMEQSQNLNKHTVSVLGGNSDRIVSDEQSWLQGVSDGFLSQHERYLRFKALEKQQQEERKRKQLPPAKLKRCRRFKKNPLAVMCLPKPAPEKVIEAEIVDDGDLAIKQAFGSAKKHGLDPFLPSSKQDGPPGIVLNSYSFKAGFRMGMQLFSRLTNLTKL